MSFFGNAKTKKAVDTNYLTCMGCELPLHEAWFPLQLEDDKQDLNLDPTKSYPGLQENVQLASVTIPEHVILPCHGGWISSQG